MVSSTNAALRTEDTRVLFDAIRNKDDDSYRLNGTGLHLPGLLSWMCGSLDSLTLREYRKAMESTDPKNSVVAGRGYARGDALDLLMHAGAKRLDNTATALLLFTSDTVGPMVCGSAASSRGTATMAIYDESYEYLSGLYDTLHYHRDLSSAAFISALFSPNIYNESQEARESITALLTVTDRIVNASLPEFCRTPYQNDPEPPHDRYNGFSESSLWLRNGALVQYILDHPKDATLIAHVIVERTTDDLATITGVLEHEVSAFSSGSL